MNPSLTKKINSKTNKSNSNVSRRPPKGWRQWGISKGHYDAADVWINHTLRCRVIPQLIALYDVIATHIGKPITARDADTLRCVVATAGLVADATTNTSAAVMYSRHKNSYYDGAYGSLRHASMLRIIDSLAATGYVTLRAADRRKHMTSAYIPTPKLISEVITHLHITADDPSPRDSIELRDDAKIPQVVPYNDTTTSRLAMLSQYAATNRTALIQLPSGAVITAEAIATYTCIFNRTTDRGGRYYAPIQNMRGDQRRGIKINGEDVTEIDFDNLHLRLLYAASRHPFPKGDGYAIPGWDRKLVKRAVLTLINAKNQTSALRSLMLHNKLSSQSAANLIRDVCERHAPVAKWFGTDIGMKLQFFDSEICTRIMAKLSSSGIIVFPIHDSFIVQKKYRAILIDAMTLSYSEVAGIPPEEVAYSVKE